MSNSYLECKQRLEEFYLTLSKEELIKRLLWHLSVEDIERMGSLEKEVD